MDWLCSSVYFRLNYSLFSSRSLSLSCSLSCSFWLEALFIFVSNTLQKTKLLGTLTCIWRRISQFKRLFLLLVVVLLILACWVRRHASRFEHGVSKRECSFDSISSSVVILVNNHRCSRAKHTSSKSILIRENRGYPCPMAPVGSSTVCWSISNRTSFIGLGTVQIFHDSVKNVYRILSVDGSKVLINTIVTSRMSFTKTSQKFCQWVDSRANNVYGLGFANEADLTLVSDEEEQRMFEMIFLVYGKICPSKRSHPSRFET